MPPSGTAPVDVDAVELVTALLRGDPRAICVLDRRTGEIHRVVGECDPEEEPRRFADEPERFVPIRAFEPHEAAAFWGRASPSGSRQPVTGSARGASAGLYRSLASLEGDARSAVLEAARDAASRWLVEQGIDGIARVRI
jgi:hypothetical protein